MLQSVSVHLMDERRQSRMTFDDRRGSRMSRRTTLADMLITTQYSHHLCPPQWYGVGVTVNDDLQPSTLIVPADNPIGWAVFNPLPIHVQKPRIHPTGRVRNV
ncbi:unnamed protein product [Cylicostephanus goldi]|uniref:Uncharacterized protein n=1 Tax=Cylicostephanus goldi TaxID=71465 RepID=A0A3P6R8B1_CYLGO|nr:unnamed protein product [Cylicostephanus goldi]